MVDKKSTRITTKSAPEPTPTQEILPPATRDAGPSFVPAFMQGDVNLGKENISRDMMEIPRLKLLQSNSPEVETNDNLRAGYFYHTLSEESLGESFIGVAVYVEEQYILWQPRDAGGGVLARTNDGVHWSPPDVEFEVTLDKKDGGGKVKWKTAHTVRESGLDQWGTFNPADAKSPPAATRMLNFLIAFPERPDLMPAVLTFQRTSIKYGKQLAGRLRTFNGPIFGAKYRFYSDTETRGKNTFKIMKASGVGVITDVTTYESYKALHMSVKGAGLNIKDVDDLQREAEADRAEGDAGSDPDKQAY